MHQSISVSRAMSIILPVDKLNHLVFRYRKIGRNKKNIHFKLTDVSTCDWERERERERGRTFDQLDTRLTFLTRDHLWMMHHLQLMWNTFPCLQTSVTLGVLFLFTFAFLFHFSHVRVRSFLFFFSSCMQCGAHRWRGESFFFVLKVTYQADRVGRRGRLTVYHRITFPEEREISISLGYTFRLDNKHFFQNPSKTSCIKRLAPRKVHSSGKLVIRVIWFTTQHESSIFLHYPWDWSDLTKHTEKMPAS